MALTALNLAALPVIAGLMAGTGAMATYVVGPATAPVPTPVEVAAPKPKPCEAQTWPYIENRCVAGIRQDRKVRLVMAPRDGIADVALADVGASGPAAPEQLVTRDTIGRPVETAAPAAMPAPPVSQRVEKRRARNERKLARQTYRVPPEASARRDTRPVIVVRPLRLDIFR